LKAILAYYAPQAVGISAVYELGHGDVKGAARLGAGALVLALLRNPTTLGAVLKSIQAAQKVAPAAAAAGTQAIERDGQDESAKPDTSGASNANQDTSDWHHIQTSIPSRSNSASSRNVARIGHSPIGPSRWISPFSVT